MAEINVRFLANFILPVVQTVIDEETGELRVQEKSVHIEAGDTYRISQYQRSPDDKVDLHFDDSSPLNGVAHRVEGDYCEIVEAKTHVTAKVTTGGCGGCGNKKKKNQ